MLKDGFAHADDDMAARKLREARVEAERMVLATRAALAADGGLLSAAGGHPRFGSWQPRWHGQRRG
jgi:molecular chaperone HscA